MAAALLGSKEAANAAANVRYLMFQHRAAGDRQSFPSCLLPPLLS